MPTTPNSLKGMVATSGKGLKALGYLVWFSVPDESVRLRTLKMTLASNGLPATLAPEDTRELDVFKRACREQEGKVRSNGNLIETDVVLVVETPEDCVYQISRVTKDLDERIAEYPKAVRMIFNKRTRVVSMNPLGDVPASESTEIATAVLDYVDANSKAVTGAKVRGIIRNYLRSEPDEGRGVEGLSGENLRGRAGGIYFIPERHLTAVESLSDALNELYKGKAYLHAVPLADNKTERELIRAHHIANTREELLEAIVEADELNRADRDRRPRSDVVSNKFAQLEACKRRAAKYKDILGDEIAEINDMTDVLSGKLRKILG